MNITGWIEGTLVLAAVPFALRYLKGKAGMTLAGWTTAALHKELSAIHELRDPDAADFLDTVSRAAIKFADKKIPGPGQGAAKKTLAISVLIKHFPLLNGQEEILGQIVDDLCLQEKMALQKEEKAPEEPPKQA